MYRFGDSLKHDNDRKKKKATWAAAARVVGLVHLWHGDDGLPADQTKTHSEGNSSGATSQDMAHEPPIENHRSQVLVQ